MVLDLRTALNTTDEYVWPIRPLMHKAVDAIVGPALAQADPGAAGSFRSNARDYADEVDSTGIDSQSTPVCPRHAIVTPDRAFSDMAKTYGLADQVVGIAATAVATLRSLRPPPPRR